MVDAGPAVMARGSILPRFSLSMAMSIVPDDSRGEVQAGEKGGGGGGGGVLRCCSSGRIGGVFSAFSSVSSMLTATGELL